jgi:hypothetical protein
MGWIGLAVGILVGAIMGTQSVSHCVTYTHYEDNTSTCEIVVDDIAEM